MCDTFTTGLTAFAEKKNKKTHDKYSKGHEDREEKNTKHNKIAQNLWL